MSLVNEDSLVTRVTRDRMRAKHKNNGERILYNYNQMSQMSVGITMCCCCFSPLLQYSQPCRKYEPQRKDPWTPQRPGRTHHAPQRSGRCYENLQREVLRTRRSILGLLWRPSAHSGKATETHFRHMKTWRTTEISKDIDCFWNIEHKQKQTLWIHE